MNIINFRKVIEQKTCIAAKVTFSDFGKGTAARDFQDQAEKVKTWFNVCGSGQLGHVIRMEWGGQGYQANIFPQNGNVSLQIF